MASHRKQHIDIAGSDINISGFTSPFLTPTDAMSATLDKSFGEDITKEESVLLIQNLVKDNAQLQDTVRQTNKTMNMLEQVLRELWKKHEATQLELKQRSEQAKTVILDLRQQIQTLKNELQKSAKPEIKNANQQEQVTRLESTECKKSDVENKTEEVEKNMTDLNLRVEELQTELIKMKEECMFRENQMSELVQQNKKLVEEKKKANDNNQQLLERIHILEAELTGLKQTSSGLNESESERVMAEKEKNVQDANKSSASKQQTTPVSEVDGKPSKMEMKDDAYYKKQLEEERQKVINLTSRINEMSLAAHSDDYIETLKAQVVCLVKEVSENEKKQKEVYALAEQYRERCNQLENDCATLRQELETLRSNDDHLIEALRSTISEMERSLADQKAKNEEQRAMIEEYQMSLSEVQDECRMLRLKLEDAQNFVKSSELNTSGGILITVEEKREQEEKLGHVTAQLLTMEDSVIQKDEEIQKMKQELNRLKKENEQIPYLRSQVESYRMDFQSEKQASLTNQKKLYEVQEELEQMRLFSHELQSQLEKLSLEHLHTAHMNHQSTRSDNMRGQQYASGGFDECDEAESTSVKTGSTDTNQSSDKERKQMREGAPNQEVCECYTCPTCGLKTQDYDSLVIHADECMKESSS